MDAQSAAFRQATETDWAGVDLDACEIYEDGDDRPIRSAQQWESISEWKGGEEAPKTLDEAKAALAARIADPTAPDDESVARVYDSLE